MANKQQITVPIGAVKSPLKMLWELSGSTSSMEAYGKAMLGGIQPSTESKEHVARRLDIGGDLPIRVIQFLTTTNKTVYFGEPGWSASVVAVLRERGASVLRVTVSNRARSRAGVKSLLYAKRNTNKSIASDAMNWATTARGETSLQEGNWRQELPDFPRKTIAEMDVDWSKPSALERGIKNEDGIAQQWNKLRKKKKTALLSS